MNPNGSHKYLWDLFSPISAFSISFGTPRIVSSSTIQNGTRSSEQKTKALQKRMRIYTYTTCHGQMRTSAMRRINCLFYDSSRDSNVAHTNTAEPVVVISNIAHMSWGDHRTMNAHTEAPGERNISTHCVKWKWEKFSVKFAHKTFPMPYYLLLYVLCI